MSTDNKVHCIVVTPEKTELDTTCDSIVVPMFDGELGIQFGRAPMVGRLGFGLMKIKSNSGVAEWFVDGGFVQVTREGVYVHTDRLLKPDQIDRTEAEADLDKSMTMVSNSPESAAFKERNLTQARARVRLAK
jgi:F-type H+-transporting ATPase subunit epsilon